MKTYKHLYPHITDFENLYAAWRKARCGKRYQPRVAAFEQNLDAELTHLRAELLAESWQPGGENTDPPLAPTEFGGRTSCVLVYLLEFLGRQALAHVSASPEFGGGAPQGRRGSDERQIQ